MCANKENSVNFDADLMQTLYISSKTFKQYFYKTKFKAFSENFTVLDKNELFEF